jgi:hypothetical protein
MGWERLTYLFSAAIPDIKKGSPAKPESLCETAA